MKPITILLYRREPTEDDNRPWEAITSKTKEEFFAYVNANPGEVIDIKSDRELELLSFFMFCAASQSCACLGCAMDAMSEARGASEAETVAAFGGLLERGWVEIGGPADVSRAN